MNVTLRTAALAGIASTRAIAPHDRKAISRATGRSVCRLRLVDKPLCRDDPSMGWRFRRSVKLLPGVRLNVGKRSAGVSVGPRGAKVSLNTKREVRRTVGLPGTGLSYTEQSKLSQADEAPAQPPAELVSDHPKRRSPRKVVGWASVAVIVLVAVLGAPTVAGYLVIPAVVLTIAAPRLASWFQARD